MIRVVIIAVAIILFSSGVFAELDVAGENWGKWVEFVGFEPDIAAAPQPGALIDATNVDDFLAVVPGESLGRLIREYGLVLEVAEYRPIEPSRGYWEATRAAASSARAIETPGSIRKKGIDGYRGGLPFPQPKTGLEVVFNHYFAYQGDDGWTRFRVYWVDAEKGVERSEDWHWSYILRAMDRTDVEPMPAIVEFEAKSIRYASIVRCLGPNDKAGTAALVFRFDEPLDQRGYLWVRSLRRAIAMVFGAPGVPWNQSDMLFEDIRGLSGYPEWWDWVLVGKATILAPMHGGVRIGPGVTEKWVDFAGFPHWNPRVQWEPRPVYVVEGRPKFWTSLYGRVVMYVDAESFLVPLKEGWGKDGALRKVVVNVYNEAGEDGPQPLALAVAVDLKRRHATVFVTWETRANVGLKAQDFTVAALVADGK